MHTSEPEPTGTSGKSRRALLKARRIEGEWKHIPPLAEQCAALPDTPRRALIFMAVIRTTQSFTLMRTFFILVESPGQFLLDTWKIGTFPNNFATADIMRVYFFYPPPLKSAIQIVSLTAIINNISR